MHGEHFHSILYSNELDMACEKMTGLVPPNFGVISTRTWLMVRFVHYD